MVFLPQEHLYHGLVRGLREAVRVAAEQPLLLEVARTPDGLGLGRANVRLLVRMRDHLQISHRDLGVQVRNLNSRVPRLRVAGLPCGLGCLEVTLELHRELAQRVWGLAPALGAHRRRLDLKKFVCALLVQDFRSLNRLRIFIPGFLGTEDTLVELGRFVLDTWRVSSVVLRGGSLALRGFERPVQLEGFVETAILG